MPAEFAPLAIVRLWSLMARVRVKGPTPTGFQVFLVAQTEIKLDAGVVAVVRLSGGSSFNLRDVDPRCFW